MRYLVATDSVHTTASACDYLEDRLGGVDAVLVATVPEGGSREGDDALNVANARLARRGEVETRRLETEGDPSTAIVAVAHDHGSDAILVGGHAGVPGAGPALGETTQQIIEAAARPVVVLPLSF